MFKRQEEMSMSKNTGGQETIIAQGVKVEGDFTSEGNVLIEGDVSGRVQTNQDLRVGEMAKIQADVRAKNAMIAGEIHGNLSIDGTLELTASSKIFGDVTTKILSVAPGAILNGHLVMGNMVGQSSSEEPSSVERAPGIEKKQRE